MKDSEFRNWVRNIYEDNKEENQLFGTPCHRSVEEYFNEFKWWLKREYQFRKKNK